MPRGDHPGRPGRPKVAGGGGCGRSSEVRFAVPDSDWERAMAHSRQRPGRDRKPDPEVLRRALRIGLDSLGLPDN